MELRKLIAGSIVLYVSAVFPARGSDFYVGVGKAVLHSDGSAFQVAAPVHAGVEAHYTRWNEGRGDRAFGVGYRFDNGSPVSVVLGVAHVNVVTPELLRHTNAYIEIRVGPFFHHYSCQISHYSTIGDDRGENLLLCGVQWR